MIFFQSYLKKYDNLKNVSMYKTGLSHRNDTQYDVVVSQINKGSRTTLATHDNVFQSHLIESILKGIGLDSHIFNSHALSILLSKGTYNYFDNISGSFGDKPLSLKTLHLEHHESNIMAPLYSDKTRHGLKMSDVPTIRMLKHHVDQHILSNLKESGSHDVKDEVYALEALIKNTLSPLTLKEFTTAYNKTTYENPFINSVLLSLSKIESLSTLNINGPISNRLQTMFSAQQAEMSQDGFNQYFSYYSDRDTGQKSSRDLENSINGYLINGMTTIFNMPLSHIRRLSLNRLISTIEADHVHGQNTLSYFQSEQTLLNQWHKNDQFYLQKAIETSLQSDILGPYAHKIGLYKSHIENHELAETDNFIGNQLHSKHDSYDSYAPVHINQTHIQMIHQTVYDALLEVNQGLQSKVSLILSDLAQTKVEEPLQSKKAARGPKAKHHKKRKTQKSLIKRVLHEEKHNLENLLSKEFEKMVLDHIHETLTSQLEEVVAGSGLFIEASQTSQVTNGLWKQIHQILNKELPDAFANILDQHAITRANKDKLNETFEKLTETYVTGLIKENRFEAIYKHVQTLITDTVANRQTSDKQTRHFNHLALEQATWGPRSINYSLVESQDQIHDISVLQTPSFSLVPSLSKTESLLVAPSVFSNSLLRSDLTAFIHLKTGVQEIESRRDFTRLGIDLKHIESKTAHVIKVKDAEDSVDLELMSRSLNNRLSESFNKSLNIRLNKSLNESLDKSLSLSINKSLNKSLNESLDKSFNKSVDKSDRSILTSQKNELISQDRARKNPHFGSEKASKQFRPHNQQMHISIQHRKTMNSTYRAEVILALQSILEKNTGFYTRAVSVFKKQIKCESRKEH